METTKPGTGGPADTQTEAQTEAKTGRGGSRRKWEMTSADVRYFLLKPGSSTERPELGREVTTEAEILVEAFRTDQPFYTVVAWKALTENENGVPRIVKEAIKRK